MPAAMKFKVADVRHGYIRRELGEDAWGVALSRFSDEDRRILERGTDSGMAPALLEGRLMVALAETAFGNDRFGFERFLRTGGASQADAMLDGIFSIFARFSNPQQALRSAPRIFSSVYVGTTATSELDSGGSSGRLSVQGLGEYAYVAPWLSGWIERALVRFGGKSASVHEREWLAGKTGSDDLVFVAKWQ